MSGIAIIGIGCRFPGAADADGFWRLLSDGRCAITEIPSERWSLDGFYDPHPDTPNRSYAKWGGFLDDIQGFDAAFFGLSQAEAEAMDPQQRLLLEVAYEAAQDARLPLKALRRAVTGVFVGVSNPDYGLLQRYRPAIGAPFAGTGTALSITANRLSNRLDLTGPSLCIDSACSSALAAVDAACRQLATGGCDLALAGAVNVLLDPHMFVTFSRAHMLSAQGRIRAFDAAADGFVRGEGAGLILLKRLDDARRAGDTIQAIIRGSLVNQDGATDPITAPSKTAQAAMIRTVLERSGIDTRALAFVEAHGTGTPVGDPIEAAAIGEVIREGRDRPLPIGSVKTNIGHLEPAAGIAGLIKAVLALKHGALPASLGFETPNPAIAFDALGLRVPTAMTPIQGRAALVNAFGFGGTNACVVLEGPEAASRRHLRAVPPLADGTPQPVPVPLSATAPAQLNAYAGALAGALEPGGALAQKSVAQIAAALACQRDTFHQRAVVLADTAEALRERLRCLADDCDWPRASPSDLPEIVTGRAKPGRRLAFAFSGQGGQWCGMARDLLQDHAVFRDWIDRFDGIFEPVSGWRVRDVLIADEAHSTIHDAAVTPAVMFALQAGLAEVWRSLGVEPELVIGHSFGEVTAAYVAGALPLEEIPRLVLHRGLIRHDVDRAGTMAAIGLGADALAPYLPADGSVEIGAYNAPGMVTVSGEVSAIEALMARLAAEAPAVRTRRLDLDFAWHSSWLDPVEQRFKQAVGDLACNAPRIPVVSSVTGALQSRFDAAYWWDNLRRPVRWQQAVETALDLGIDTVLELSPHRTLSGMTAECAAARGQDVLTVSTLHRGQSDHLSLAHAVAQLHCAGIDVDWQAVAGAPARDIALPRLPWMRRRHWQAPEEAAHALSPARHHPLLGTRDEGPIAAWRNEISLATHPDLAQHRIVGQVLFPAACTIELLRAAAAEMLGDGPIELSQVYFAEALAIEPDAEIALRTVYLPERRRLEIHSRTRGAGPHWTLRASAQAVAHDATLGAVAPPSDGALLDVGAFYEQARSRGYEYGPAFQGLVELRAGPGGAWGRARTPTGAQMQGTQLDPVLLDACLQLMIAAADEGAAQPDAPLYLPTSIDRIWITGRLSGSAVAEAHATQEGRHLRAGFTIAAADGEAVIEIEGLHACAVALRERRDARAGRFYREIFIPVAAEGAHSSNQPVILLACEGGPAATALAEALRACGAPVTVAAVPEAEACDSSYYAHVLREATDPKAAIVFALPLDAADPASDAALPDAMEERLAELLAFGQALAKRPFGRAWLLTRNARHADDADNETLGGLAQSALPGLARTLALEVPDTAFHLADLDAAACADPRAAAAAIASPEPDAEYAVRGGDLFTARIGTIAEEALPPRTRRAAEMTEAHSFALRRGAIPGPESLFWQETEAPDAPGANEVQIDVLAAGLNFRDVMAVSGLLPEEAEASDATEALGLEYCGIVRACGAQVRGLAPGERVLGLARGALRRRLTVSAESVHPAPGSWSDAEAAAFPAAFLTAHYAFDEVARLRPGETVLIHSAAGGVGLAAIALARRRGASIIATAGTEAKRATLRGLGIAHVFDSRDLGFADAVMRATNGRGVDVVLNALSGAFAERGLSCLAPFGRFVELGKRDVYDDAALGMKALRRNASLHVVDVAALIEERPDQVRCLLSELLSEVADGRLAPLPVRTFKGGAVADAFAYLTTGEHMGKATVDLRDADAIVRRHVSRDWPVRRDATYLVAGGTRGFGFAVAGWLAREGTGRVVLASRSGTPPPEAAAILAAMRMGGTCVECVAADLSNLDETRALIGRLAMQGPALKGIVHAAVAYDDARLADMSRARLAGVLAPKVAGAINLTRAVLEHDIALDHFVSFSSLAAVIGWVGQSNYAAANAALPALAHYQRRLGLPGQCIAWGALAQSGFVARTPALASHLSGSGWIGLDDAEALDALKTALASDAAVVTYAGAHWRTLAMAHPALARSPRLAGLIEAQDGAAAHSGDPTAAHAGATPQARAEAFVRAQMGKVLHMEAEALAPFDTLDDAGLDSLSSLELRSRLEAAIGLPVPMARFTQAGSIAELATLIRVLIDAGSGSGSAEQEPAASDEPPVPQMPEAAPGASQTTHDSTVAAAE